jgi:SAM-dependent methyltransferase
VAENLFTERIARDCAALWPHLFEPGMVVPAVDFLAGLAEGGDALEFGVGTGRLALPLSERGLEVHGIDLSPDMLEELGRQPGAGTVRTVLGDCSTTRVEGREGSFAVVYVVRNTIMNVTTQDAQVACFVNAAWHLRAGGKFVMEVMVPELRRLPPGTSVRAFATDPEHLGFEQYDVATQQSVSFHVWERDGRIETFDAPFRYVWPAELDLMARLAGLVLCERWGDWDRSPFRSESRSHISVWAKDS